jgi:hypothetical protein
MLDLRGNRDTLAVGKGEDCLLTKANDVRVYRQAKTKSSGSWTLSDPPLTEYIQRSYERYRVDSSVRHEFHTDANVSAGAYMVVGNRKILNLSASQLAFIQEPQREAFCSSFVFQEKYTQLTENVSRLVLKGRMRDMLSSEYPRTLAYDLVKDSEWDAVLTRLIDAETRLFRNGVEISWDEVDQAVQLELLIQAVSVRSRAGGAFVPWQAITTLSEDYRNGVTAIQSQKMMQQPLVDQFVVLVGEWLKGKELAAILLLAPHGTGKTWTLLQAAERLYRELPNVSVCFVAGPPPDRIVELEAINAADPKPCVAFIDDVFDNEWHHLLALSRRLQNGRVLFIASAAVERQSPEVEDLQRSIPAEQLKKFFLPASISPSEAHILAMAVRRLAPAQSEMDRITKTNIRFAAAILRGEEVPPHVAKLRALCSQRMELLESLCPLLVCASLGITLPSSVVAKALGRAIPDDLKPWIITSRQRHLAGLTFEDAGEANLLLTDLYDAAVEEARYSTLERLVAHCDPLDPVERGFCRKLLHRVAKRSDMLADRLLRSSKRLIEQILPLEPLWAAAFSWLPIINAIKDQPLRDHLAGLISTSGDVQKADSIVELMLWMDIYANAAVSKYFSLRAKSNLLHWDADRIARLAKIVRQLPSSEQRPIARKFCGLFRRLPEELVHECLLLQDTFSLFAALLSDHGGPVDREIGLHQLGTTLIFQRKLSHRIAQTWTESYAKLVDRTFRQSRNRLSLRIAREVVSGKFTNLRPDYDDCRQREHARTVHPLLEEWMNIYRLLQEGSAADERTVLIAANALSSAAMWADMSDWSRLIQQYLVSLKNIAENGVPLGRISPLVTPAFEAFRRRGDLGECKQLLEILLFWVPRPSTTVTEETTKFMFRLYGFVAGQSWLGEEFRILSRDIMETAIFDAGHAESLGKQLLQLLNQKLQTPSFEPHPNCGLMAGWIQKDGPANAYLSSASHLKCAVRNPHRVGGRIVDLWASRRSVVENVCAALFRIMELEAARPVITDVLMRYPNVSDVHALAGILAALEMDAPQAYEHLSRVVDLFERQQMGARLSLHWWLHTRLAAITPKTKAILHLLCAELVSDHRLRSYDDVLATDFVSAE